jgi:DNA-binding NarL/FixJ family response regulator
MAIDELSLRKRQILIGRAKKMFDEGRSWKEICEELGVSESTVRSIRHTIEQAEINRSE